MDYHKGLETVIDLPHDDLNTVCVRYYNSINSDKNGDYFASILVDTTLPTGGVSYTLDRKTKTFYFSFNATDDLTDVSYIKYRLPSGYEDMLSYASIIAVGPNTPLTNLFGLMGRSQGIYFSFLDTVGNKSQDYYVPISAEDDIFPPEVQMVVNNDNPYTNNTDITISLSATDNFGLSRIWVKELKTGKTWTIPETGTLSGQSYSESRQITIPSRTINGNEIILDGTYDFVAYAEDTKGNLSRYTNISRIILDREAPIASSILITDTGGKSYTTKEDIILNMQLAKDITPVSFRYRFKPDGAWSDYITVYPGTTSISLKGPTPMPSSYVLEIELKDGAGNTVVKEASIRTNRRPEMPSISVSTKYSTTPVISIDYSDADGDKVSGACFIIRKVSDGSTIFSTGIIETPYFQVPSGFLRYNTDYVLTGYVVDSTGLSSYYAE
jgi:hypothetical protein